MAKRLSRVRGAVAEAKEIAAKLTPRDKKTMGSIVGLADGVVVAAEKRRDPHVDIPSRTLSNVRYSPRKRIIEMGNSTNRRQLFDLAQAKAYMRTMLVASGCKKLLTQGKTTSLRGMYYMLKHTIEGTKENTFDDQDESDTIIEDLEVLLSSIREELHLYAKAEGTMIGNITIVDRGDTIDCSRMGSGGYGIPSIVEQEVIQLDPKNCDAKFVLHVEKDTVWRRFNEDKEIQALLKELANVPASGLPVVNGYSKATADALKAHTFDRVGLGARGLAYEKLDQLTVEVILGVR